MTDDPSDDLWNTPELIAFRLTSRACYLAGNDYKTPKDIIATEDEVTPLELRKIDPLEVGTLRTRLLKYREAAEGLK